MSHPNSHFIVKCQDNHCNLFNIVKDENLRILRTCIQIKLFCSRKYPSSPCGGFFGFKPSTGPSTRFGNSNQASYFPLAILALTPPPPGFSLGWVWRIFYRTTHNSKQSKMFINQSYYVKECLAPIFNI